MDRDNFLHLENWRGGPSDDLSMAWAPGDDARLFRALRALAAAPDLRGPWASPSHFPAPTAPPTTLDRESGYKGYSLLRLPDGPEAGCLMLALLSGPGGAGDYAEADWLKLAIMRRGVVCTGNFRRDKYQICVISCALGPWQDVALVAWCHELCTVLETESMSVHAQLV